MADISTILRKMRVWADRHMADQNIGFPEQLVLMHLKAKGPSNQESLAIDLNIDKGSIARTLTKLEEKGLVTREVNENNKREKLVELSPAAEGVLKEMWKLYQQIEVVMYAGLTEQEIARTNDCLARIAENLSESMKE